MSRARSLRGVFTSFTYCHLLCRAPNESAEVSYSRRLRGEKKEGRNRTKKSTATRDGTRVGVRARDRKAGGKTAHAPSSSTWRITCCPLLKPPCLHLFPLGSPTPTPRIASTTLVFSGPLIPPSPATTPAQPSGCVKLSSRATHSASSPPWIARANNVTEPIHLCALCSRSCANVDSRCESYSFEGEANSQFESQL